MMKAQSVDVTMTEDPAEADSERRVICVRAQDSYYAMDLDYVECVLPLMELQPIPGGAGYLAGMMNFHGKGLAVVDLGLWLGLNRPQRYDLDTPVIVCGSGNAQMAFIANEVLRIEPVKPNDMHRQGFFKEGAVPFEASLKLSFGVALLLDMQHILDVNFAAVGVGAGAADERSR